MGKLLDLISFRKRTQIEYSIGKEDDDGYTLIRVDSGKFKDLVFRVLKVSLNVENVGIQADLLCLPDDIKPEDVKDQLKRELDQCIIDVVDDIIKQ